MCVCIGLSVLHCMVKLSVVCCETVYVMHSYLSLRRPPRMEPKPSPPPAGPSAAAVTQSNTELVAALDTLKLEFKKLREEYRKDIDTLMADLDQERKKVRSLEVDVDRLKKRYHREN